MSLPSGPQLKQAADDWWLELPAGRRLRLDVVSSRLAKLVGQPNAAVRCRLANLVGVYTIVVELEIFESTPGAGDGQLITRQWAPSVARPDGIDLADVFDPARGKTMRENGE